MNFNNLTNEQVEWLEQKIREAYEEGAYDGRVYVDCVDFDTSMSKNYTCHTLAERFMKCVEEI